MSTAYQILECAAIHFNNTSVNRLYARFKISGKPHVITPETIDNGAGLKFAPIPNLQETIPGPRGDDNTYFISVYERVWISGSEGEIEPKGGMISDLTISVIVDNTPVNIDVKVPVTDKNPCPPCS